MTQDREEVALRTAKPLRQRLHLARSACVRFESRPDFDEF